MTDIPRLDEGCQHIGQDQVAPEQQGADGFTQVIPARLLELQRETARQHGRQRGSGKHQAPAPGLAQPAPEQLHLPAANHREGQQVSLAAQSAKPCSNPTAR